jgi:hypothetical protein
MKRSSERSRRISIDIDAPVLKKDKFAVLKAYFQLKTFFPHSDVQVDKTGHGFHVKAVGDEVAKIPIEKRVQIRETLCDDPMRIEYDKKKLEWGLPQFCETLFVMKRGFDRKLHIAYQINPVSMPSASRLPANKAILSERRKQGRP